MTMNFLSIQAFKQKHGTSPMRNSDSVEFPSRLLQSQNVNVNA